MKKLFFSLVIFSLIAGCTSMSQKLSSHPLPHKYEELGQGECKACSFILFSLIPIMHSSMPQRAYRCAVEEFAGDDLINPTIQESWYWTPVGNLRCTKVSGVVIKAQ